VKGGQTLGFGCIIMGAILMYAGFKNVPVLSVLGIGAAAGAKSGTPSSQSASNLPGGSVYTSQVPTYGNTFTPTAPKAG
jgi:hypothetical protein